MPAQPASGGECEAHRKRAAPGRDERGQGAVPQYRRAKGVRHYEATFFGDEKARKFIRDSKIEPVRELPVEGPLAIRPEIGHRAFDLDDHQVAFLAERDDVGAAAVGEREFEEAGIAEL